ncbi:hypothetical protein AAE478_004221 [Parahypoxylon ruwenzoriense]
MATGAAEPRNGVHYDGKGENDDHIYASSVDIAIVGGGIIGVMTALGLLHAGYQVTVYEKADRFHEMGVGMAFTGVARECMRQLNPLVLEALQSVSQENNHPMNRYWDGFNPTSKGVAQSEESLLFQTSARELAFSGCLRTAFLHRMTAILPKNVVMFEKDLENYSESDDGRVVLRFTDGSTAEADAVVGCDGIGSRTRQLLLGEHILASRAHFAHKVAYRAIVPIADAVAAIGEDKANNQCAHLGPDAHILSYPVAKWTLVNLFICAHDPNQWPDSNKMSTSARRDEVAPIFRDWSPAIRELVDKIPEELPKWGIFDMADYPAKSYARGSVCLAGDAAHASSPFHGTGACMGVEDALVLVTALNTAISEAGEGSSAFNKAHLISAAFQTYSAIRLERSQWQVDSAREAGDIYQWRYPSMGNDADKAKDELDRRSKILWDFDVDEMVAETKKECEIRLKTR